MFISKHTLHMSRSRSRGAHLFLASVLFLAGVIALTLWVASLTTREARAQSGGVTPKSALRIVHTPSKHYTRVSSRKVDTVVVHYMSGINVDKSRWADPALCRDILNRYKVSAHYIIDRGGTVYKLVDESHTAWHAGGSIMPAPDNRKNVNRFSIGIELIGTHTSGFTDAQYESLTALTLDIKSRHNIRHVVGHDEIAGLRAVKMGLRKDVKPDPGPRFDWSRFREMLRASE